MADVLIRYSTLELTIERLNRMIDELDSGDRATAIEQAIAMPFMRSELTTTARESESRWSIKRGELVDELKAIRDHAQEIYDAFEQFDDEAAAQFESGADAPPPAAAN